MVLSIKKILYPTDFSEQATRALGYAREMAEKFGAELHCLHVLDEMYYNWLMDDELGLRIDYKEVDFHVKAEEQMEAFMERHFGAERDKVITQIVKGRPYMEIVRYAQEKEIDLIVMATHGHGALASMLLGSVAEKVIRKSPCAVLLVRQADHKTEIN